MQWRGGRSDHGKGHFIMIEPQTAARGRLRRAFEIVSLSAVLTTAGCANEVGPEAPTRVQSETAELGIGSQGDRVLDLHRFLTRFGYFPNDQLARQYPRWRPLVAVA